MALQVWLPLNGNLDNLGLSNITVTNNGAMVNDNGKIGKCYSFNGSNNKITSIISPTITSSTGSIACWVKFNSFPGSSSFYELVHIGENAGYAKCLFGIYMEYTNYINISINGSSTATNRYTHSLSTNTWYHLCATLDGTTVKLYINGSEVLSKTATKASYNTPASTIYIGGTNYYWLNGYINDVRIYDHCLSPKEVKEISKGLVLHYPLDDMMRSNINLLPESSQRMTTEGQTSSSEYIALCSPLSIYETYGLVPYTVSFDIKAAVPHSFLLYGTPGSNYKYSFAATYVDVTTEWQRITYTFTPRLVNEEGTWASISVYGTYGSGAIVSVRKVKLELGNIETPLFEDDNIVYDCSGYNNNGTIVGNVSIDLDTPRYNKSLVIQSSSTITHQNTLSNDKQEWTCCAWIKPSSLPNYSTLNNFNLGNKLVNGTYPLLYVNAGTNDFYNYGNKAIVSDEWQHVAFVFKNGTISGSGTTSDAIKLIYINGVNLTSTNGPNRTNTPSGIPDNVVLFGGNFSGNVSDYREYCTALSPEDILELYNTSAFIYNNGTVAAYELNETENNLFTLDNWNLNAKNTVNWTTRNGESAVQLNANNFYYGSSDDRNRCLVDLFKPNTQYMFDMWIDYDDIVSGGNRLGGITIVYTDNTTSQALCDVGDHDNPIGWKHKIFYSDPSKSIKCLSVYYYTSTGAFYRWDSIITPVSSEANIQKTGVLNGSVFNENSDIAQIYKGGIVNSNQIIEI